MTSNNFSPLSLQNIHISYATRAGLVQAIRGVTLDLRAGESLALIGESGSGKTTLGLGIVRLLAKTARIEQGTITYRRDGREIDVLNLRPAALRRFRWSECAIVFQSALNAFNPVLRIWDQVWDAAHAHGWKDSQAVRRQALDLLRFVQLDPNRVINAYPHELSGGMRQRALIAIALLLNPQILILDEPTTALDILTQRTIIDLLRRLKEEHRFAMIFISHDLALAAELAEQLTAFGIQTSFRGVNFQQHPIDVRAGDFQMAIRDWGAGNPHPHFSYDIDFNSYNVTGGTQAATAGPGMNFPLTQETSQGELDLGALTDEAGLGNDVEAQRAIQNVMRDT